MASDHLPADGVPADGLSHAGRLQLLVDAAPGEDDPEPQRGRMASSHGTASTWATASRSTKGRFVLCVGLGAIDDGGWGKVGEPTERRIQAERLDETLEILTGLWGGEPFGFEGTHYRFTPMAFRPTPLQRPRIPIWVVGAWPAERSMTRAARYDGLLPNVVGGGSYTAEMIGQMRDWIAQRRGSTDGFDIVLEGPTEPGAADDELRRFADAGATWWIESNWETFDPAVARRRIEAGPPQF